MAEVRAPANAVQKLASGPNGTAKTRARVTRAAARKTLSRPRAARGIARLIAVIHHGRDPEEDSMLDYGLFADVRDKLDSALARAGSPDKDSVEIDLWLDSGGGDAHAAYKLVLLFRSRSARFRVVIPDYAKSAATLMVLGADEIYMSRTAELGPLDAQIPYEEGGLARTLSALDVSDSVDQLYKSAVEMVITGGASVVECMALSREETLANVLDFVAKFTSPLVAKHDPAMIHQSSNLLRVAVEYGNRLLRLRQEGIGGCDGIPEYLVKAYPSHNFVISRAEARECLRLPVSEAETYEYWPSAESMFQAYESDGSDIVEVMTIAELNDALKQEGSDEAE